ncbi:insecticidal delta-endotoxin Cry8Ea1 family protein [Bacillus sp. AF62]|uniref:insecticidal delta-endotoxin Cry8Ea1 family protein n=1 Tax=Bacillus sp. AF62 TaxID=3158960 RepID=UPI003D02ECCC
MATLNELYPVPYNVLANPPMRLSTTDPNVLDAIEKIGGLFTDYSKDKKFGEIASTISEFYKAFSGDSVKWLEFTKGLLGIAGFYPPIGAAMPFINLFLNIFWPAEDKTAHLFKIIMEAVQKLVEQTFQSEILGNLQSEITGFQSNLQHFSDAISDAIVTIGTPPTVNKLIDVKSKFEVARGIIEAALPKFKNPLDSVSSNPTFQRESILLTLPLYTIAATMNLTLHQSYINFMDHWGILTYGSHEAYEDAIGMHRVKIDLRKRISTDSSTILSAFSQYMPPKQSTTKSAINTYIRYVRSMTTNSLDLVALWPTLYPDLYPKRTELDQTRSVFGDIIGPTEYNSNINIQVIDIYNNNRISSEIPSYSYPSSYSRLELSESNFHGYSSTSGPYTICAVDGVKLKYDGGAIFEYGPASDAKTIQNLQSLNMKSQIGPTTQPHSNVDNTALYVNDSTWTVTSGCYDFLEDQMASSHNSSNNTVISNHKINTIYPVKTDSDDGGTQTSSKIGFLYSLILNDIAPTNSLDNKIQISNSSDLAIKAFPAEKGSLNNNIGTLQYVQEPLNGAAAVKLTSRQILQLPIINSNNLHYSIRIRYASNSNIDAYIHIETDNYSQGPGPISLPKTQVSVNDDDIYKDEKVMYTPGVDNKQYTSLLVMDSIEMFPGSSTVYIQNNSQEDLFLDRIEFIPISRLEFQDLSFSADRDDVKQIDGFISYYADLWQRKDTELGYVINIDPTFLDSRPTYQFFNGENLVHEEPNTAMWSHGQTITVPEGFTKVRLNDFSASDALKLSITGTININKPTFFALARDLTNITTQVNALFASGTQDALAKDVSDYEIEEVVLKVDALSDEVFGNEKKALRKLVNQAKRLSKARNLLIGGSFDKLNAWYRGRHVVAVSDHELLKSDHILLPPPTLYPSYIFQKVEESKLKANTRYTVSGFIAHAIDLEIVVSRYGQEVKKVVQVPYGEAFPLTSSGPICCRPRSRVNGKPADPHFFSYSIDVGALDVEANPGIELGLRIVEPTGMARVSNLEIREDRPLTANELRKVQRAARNWRTAYDQERAEVTALIQPVLNQINALYENEDWNGAIRSGVSYHDLEAIVLPTLPKLNHWFMSDMLGEQGSILAQFQEALDRAYTQLEGSTILHNGHFTKDAANWTVEGDAHQVVLEDGRRVLQLPDWSSSVSQTIEIENFDPNKEYQLVFHGQGEGTVKLEHGEETKYIETHTHHFANFTTSQRQGLTFESNKVTVTISSEDGEFLADNIAIVEVPMFNKNQMVNENRGVNINSNTNMNSSNNQ